MGFRNQNIPVKRQKKKHVDLWSLWTWICFFCLCCFFFGGGGRKILSIYFLYRWDERFFITWNLFLPQHFISSKPNVTESEKYVHAILSNIKGWENSPEIIWHVAPEHLPGPKKKVPVFDQHILVLPFQDNIRVKSLDIQQYLLTCRSLWGMIFGANKKILTRHFGCRRHIGIHGISKFYQDQATAPS